MSKAKGFSDDIESLSAAVDADVGRVVTMMRNGTHAASDSSLDPASTSTTARTLARSTRQEEPLLTQASIVNSHDSSVALVNVTTRLPQAINELLSESALRQKLAKRKPDNRQDIVAEALADWFLKYRYADSP